MTSSDGPGADSSVRRFLIIRWNLNLRRGPKSNEAIFIHSERQGIGGNMRVWRLTNEFFPALLELEHRGDYFDLFMHHANGCSNQARYVGDSKESLGVVRDMMSACEPAYFIHALAPVGAETLGKPQDECFRPARYLDPNEAP